MEKIKRRNPVISFLISLLLPGLGQVYNGQWVRGVSCYVGMLLLNVAVGLVGLAHWLYGLCIALVISIGASILIAADAAGGSARIKEIALKPYNKWYVYVILVVVLGLGSLSCDRLWQIKPYKIPSAGMEPTLLVGDRIMTQLNTFSGHKPTRGDIVVFPYPEDPSYNFVMRVVGLEGETLEIRNKKVFIDRELLEEPWARHFDSTIRPGNRGRRDNLSPTRIPAGSVFVMGDNRDFSHDSRFWGFVESKDIRGKALYIYWAKDRSRIGREIK